MKVTYTVEEGVKIKNANGTAGRKCRCGSWIDHWEKFSGKNSSKCCVDGCENKATDGAHVTRPKANNDDYKTHPYIIPMCSSHNMKHGQEFRTMGNVTFVWANVAETCGA